MQVAILQGRKSSKSTSLKTKYKILNNTSLPTIQNNKI